MAQPRPRKSVLPFAGILLMGGGLLLARPLSIMASGTGPADLRQLASLGAALLRAASFFGFLCLAVGLYRNRRSARRAREEGERNG